MTAALLQEGLSPDAELVAQSRRGDREAFGRIVRRHQGMVAGSDLFRLRRSPPQRGSRSGDISFRLEKSVGDERSGKIGPLALPDRPAEGDRLSALQSPRKKSAESFIPSIDRRRIDFTPAGGAGE